MQALTPETAPSDSRYHGLDNLRALMMWLGVVLHGVMVYSQARTAVPLRDDQHSLVADLLVAFIHAFRMPVFFIVAGLLAAMLLQRRGVRQFLRHRMLRLALPFAVFWPFLWMATGLVVLAFLNRTAFGRWGLDMAAIPLGTPTGPSTVHLWFLWMLIWFCWATALLSRLPRAPLSVASAWLARLGTAWWGVLVLMLPLVLAGHGYPQGLLIASGAFWLPWNEWLHNGVFFAFGVALWAHRTQLLPHYQKHWARYALAGLPLFMAFGPLFHAGVHWTLTAACYNALAWLWSFAWIGFALRVLSARHAVLAYLADSAYWVYLMHLPLAIGISSLLYQQGMPALAKMAVNIAGTTVLCLLSYQLFVRHTWVGVLLNGRRGPAHQPEATEHQPMVNRTHNPL